MAQTRSLTTAGMIRSNLPLWRVVTHNPFLAGVRDGDLPDAVFRHWLVQDRYFVDALFPCVCRVLAIAPAADRPLLVEALKGLAEYHVWFEAETAKRKLDRSAPLSSAARSRMQARGRLQGKGWCGVPEYV